MISMYKLNGYQVMDYEKAAFSYYAYVQTR